MSGSLGNGKKNRCLLCGTFFYPGKGVLGLCPKCRELPLWEVIYKLGNKILNKKGNKKK